MIPVNGMNSSSLLDFSRDEFHHYTNRNWVEIDLSIIRSNVETILCLIGPDRLLMPCVKCNAYGHGFVQAGLAAIQGGANRLCVAFVEEGIVLRRAGITVPIQVLFDPTPQNISEWQEFDLIASLSSISVIPALAANLTAPIKAHIHVDTGLGRVSLQPENVVEFYKILSAFDCFEIEGVFSHFSNSYQLAEGRNKEVTMNQLLRFKYALTTLKKNGFDIPLKHMANSGGILQYPESYFDMVRPGNLVYGYRPNYSPLPLKAALSWKTQIRSLVKALKEVGIGYNQAYIPATDTTIALIDIGFADGFPSGLSGSGNVLVHGVKAPIVGTMSMDQTMIDVGHISNLRLCEEVVLVGRQENIEISAVELGDNLSVNPSSISCGISRRTCITYKNASQL